MRASTRFLVLALALVAARASTADAAMMEHFDLAGLVLQSGAIVVAKRTGPTASSGPAPSSGTSHYAVVRSLRGNLKPGADLVIYDGLYGTEHHTIDPEVTLFLAPDGHLLLSGMRVVESGKVFRFEQWSNPGGWYMVPQGKDPADTWEGTTTPIDRGEFDRELALAFTRVDAMAIARTISDPAKRRAAILSLLPPVGSRAQPPGFYVDRFTQAAEDALVAGGDLEGALEASRHDHSFNNMGREFGALAAIMQITTDDTRPIALRATALRAAAERNDFIDSESAGRTAITLVSHPAPEIRAIAVTAIARAGGVTTSDAKEQARLDRLARDGRTAVAAQLARESDERVLFAIASAFSQRPFAARAGHPVAAHAEMRRGMLGVEVVCLSSGHSFTDGKVVATQGSRPVPIRSTLGWACRGEGQGTGSNGPETLAAGHYDLSVDVVIDRKHVLVPLGSLASDGTRMTLDAP